MIPRLLLASRSPRRCELISRLGVPFRSLPADCDESVSGAFCPEMVVRTLAERKARAVQCEAQEDEYILGADTLVCIGGAVLGKPASESEAAMMLRRLSGNWHEVMTGLVLLTPSGRCYDAVETARVHFVSLGEEEIASYLASGEPMDKAGAYGIQGRAGLFIDRIEGDYYTVVGLPISRLYQIWKTAVAEEVGA